MDENEVIEPQGALSQVSAPAPQVSAPASQVEKPQPSEYEKAMLAYQQQKLQLLNRQRDIISSLEERIGGPAEMMLAFAGGIGSSPFFGENLGSGVRALNTQQAQERQARSEIAKMRLELQMQELGMAKEDVDLARTREASKGLQQMISGAPGQAGGTPSIPPSVALSIQNRLAAGDIKGAQDLYDKYVLESEKKPDQVRAFEFYLEQLKSPQAKAIATQLAANNYFLGSPAERSRAILEIRKQADAGEGITRQEADILIGGLTSIGGWM